MLKLDTMPQQISALDPSPRAARISQGHADVALMLQRMIRLAKAALPRMFRADRREFGFSLRRNGRHYNGSDHVSAHGMTLKGRSVRYGAIVAMGAGRLEESAQREVFGGESASEFCGRLVRSIDSIDNLGDAALITWAAALLGLSRSDLGKAMSRLSELWRGAHGGYTVEVAWTLSALAQASATIDAIDRAAEVRERLLTAFIGAGDLFRHRIAMGRRRGGWRSDIGCFADQVYPIQALARHHHAFDDPSALQVAARCAERICQLQGDAGQWWWHYDTRTGRVVEGYPVYSVHQNSMAPMALLDLHEAGGPDLGEAIRRGVRWMGHAPEIGRSLIDEENLVIWRKVGRNDPQKIVRGARALASRVHPNLRLTWLDGLFPARTIDFESRPYHLGWILHAWLGTL
jgi:hypothetical protein